MDEKLREFYEGVCTTEEKDPCGILLKNKELLKGLKIEDKIQKIRGVVLNISDNNEATYLPENTIEINVKTKTLVFPLLIKKKEIKLKISKDDILKITSCTTGVQINIEIDLS